MLRKMEAFLGAEELRIARSLPRHLPGRGGMKTIVIDDVLGQSNLDDVLDERKAVLAEPKVEKFHTIMMWKNILMPNSKLVMSIVRILAFFGWILTGMEVERWPRFGQLSSYRSSLIKGEWVSDKRVVRILKNVGRHLQHMGRSESGERLLYPEEAMFLLDIKCMEIYYHGLPLSCQEAYNIFFTHPVDLLRYQTYSHLSRLGYVVIRHVDKTNVTDYERKIKLDTYLRKNKDRTLKTSDASAATSDSGATSPELTISLQRSPTVSVNYDPKTGVQTRNCEIVPPKASPSCSQDLKPCLLVRHPEISFPNVFGKRLFGVLSPASSYLPPNVTLNKEMYLIDLVKLYSRTNMTRKEFESHFWRRDETTDESLAHRLLERMSPQERHQEYKRRRLNKSGHNGNFKRQKQKTTGVRWRPESTSKNHEVVRFPKSQIKTEAKSWRQYKKESGEVAESSKILNSSNGASTCTPLVHLRNTTSVASLLNRLQIIEQVRLSNSISSKVDLLNVDFDVYLPNVKSKFSKIMLPNHRLVVTSVSEPLPKMDQILHTLGHFKDDVPIHFAVVDNGDIAFYSFNDVSVTVDSS